ncbi:BspA family leucine-rich repeat surface protein [Mycoplasma mycoides]|uniref:BspA family leucine-rich repeat surface protein n=1 Tax=Mycoplasma mycoides TaxID=2102 RepID=UPI002240C057|nr:BspA family leucine-rich repeat surface protein [Mycoplasma mycoides]QVJ95125.1 DUF285 domain-containing protein [Mycoplasma mycoides subsp. capri]
MKKLLSIFTSTSAIFLITAGIVLVNNKEDNLRINYNITYYQRNEIKDGKLVKIGYYQWGNHKRIEQIPTTINVIAAELPKEITSLRYAFAGAKHNVTWEVKWDTSNVTDMNSLFYGRDQFNSSDILDWDTSNVTDMSEMFAGATEFNQDLSKWNVSKVKDMSKMFNGATSFTYDLSSWEVSNNVKKDNFGLNEEKQPKWKKLEETLAVKDNETTTNSNSSPKQTSPKTPDTSDITNNNIDLSNSTIELENEEILANTPTKEDEPKLEESTNMNSDQSNQTQPHIKPESSIENETIEESTDLKDNISSKSNNKKNLIIPSAKSSLKNLSNQKTKAIVSGVVGSTAVITTTSLAGFSYYYRKNLKDLFLKLKKRWFKSN